MYAGPTTTLGTSVTSIHSILHEHLTVKQICSHWITHNLSIAQKKARVDWSEEMLQKYKRGASKHVYDIVADYESGIYAYSPKVNSSRLYGCFKMRKIQQKLLVLGCTSKQMIAWFFGKTEHVVIVPLEQRRKVNSEWYTTICLPLIFQEIKKNRRRPITLQHDNTISHTLT